MKYLFTAFGIFMGFILAYSLTLLGRWKDHLRDKKRSKSGAITALDALWRIALPIAFGIIGLLLPLEIIPIPNPADCQSIKNTAAFHLYSFSITYLLSFFILIKTGKIKTSKRLSD